jgi:hypothetical protein
MANPTLVLIPNPPDAVRQAALVSGHTCRWTLKATFPAPHGTVFLRYSEPEQGEDALDVLSSAGKLLQRLRDTHLPSDLLKVAPKTLGAGWLDPRTQKGPMAIFTLLDYEDKTPYRMWLAFPEGFVGICTLSREWDTTKKYAWNGLEFTEANERNAPAATDVSPPPALIVPGTTRFGAAFFGGRRFLLRWTKTGGQITLAILDSRGRLLARHRLQDDFSATKFTTLSAMWLDEKRKHDPILQARDSDMVRLHVFSDDFSRLICVQDFNDSSSSISATTVRFGRDKRGILTVTEIYSERTFDDGSGGESHETNYVWNGHSFR